MQSSSAPSAPGVPVRSLLTKQRFDQLLATKGSLVIDGGLATELEERGHDLNHPLWSGRVLQEDPAAISDVHLDYWRAGADIAITASYQTSIEGLKKHLGLDEPQGRELMKQSAWAASAAAAKLHLASDSLDSSSRDLLIAGSVGPYGAWLADGSEYRGDYQLSIEEFQAFHRPRIQALIESRSIDFLALETIPNFVEIEALLLLLADEFPTAIAWLSCTPKDDQHLSDGTPFAVVLDLVNKHSNQIIAFGLNCCAPDRVSTQLQYLQEHTSLPLLCYPNSGETYNADGNTWSGSKAGSASGRYALQWQAAGAKLIGGCCRTGPDDIKSIAEALRK